jgi:DNA-binding transcriptional regulator YiaG
MIHTTKVGRWTVKDEKIVPVRVSKSGEPVLSAEQLGQIEVRAAITVFASIELVGGAELKFARKALGLKQTDLAEHLGVTSETVSRWETEAEPFKRPIQLAVLSLLQEFLRNGALSRALRASNASNRVLKVGEI